jgi:hypothetical protein
MAVDGATGGYWLVAADGGVFSFNAPFHGSAGSIVLNKPVVGMEAAPDGSGYRLAARDGGVFSFDLPFAGSWAGQNASPMLGITGSGSSGYWLLDSCGGIYSFGPPSSSAHTTTAHNSCHTYPAFGDRQVPSVLTGTKPSGPTNSVELHHGSTSEGALRKLTARHKYRTPR